MEYILIITFLNISPIYGKPYQEMQIVGSGYTAQECDTLGAVYRAAMRDSETKRNFAHLCIGVEGSGWF